MFQLDKISFSYPGAPRLFHEFCLSLDPEQNTLLQGENGSGKSTLVSLMTGQLKPSKGSIKARGSYFYLPQNSDSRILGLNLMQDIRLWQIAGWNIDAESLLKHPLLSGLGIDTFHAPIWELSTGTRKAYMLALALQREDEYLVLDEPFAALDAFRLELALDLLLGKKGMLIISHQCEAFQQRFDSCYVLDRGRLV